MSTTARFSKIRVLETGHSNAALNMAIDEALIENIGNTPILRIYGWRPAAVSIGYFQSIKEEVDLEKCSKIGVDASFIPLNDIVVNGKKVSGSAQTRRNGVLLQHGTILLGLDVDKMFSLLKVPSEKLKDKIIKDVKERVTSLAGTTFEEVASSLKTSFATKFDAKLLADTMSTNEISRARWLAERKYSSREWNFRR